MSIKKVFIWLLALLIVVFGIALYVVGPPIHQSATQPKSSTQNLVFYGLIVLIVASFITIVFLLIKKDKPKPAEGSAEELDQVKHDIKRIRRAGLVAELFGILIILLTSVLLWYPLSKIGVFVIGGVGLVVGLYFVCSGRYLKDGRGRRTKGLLLANGIMALPLCVLIVPIYVCVQSFKNYSRFKNFPDKVRQLYNRPKPFDIQKLEIVVLFILIVITAGSFALKLKHPHTTLRPASKSTANPQAAASVTSKYQFTINFPGPVSPTDFTEQVSGHEVTYTTYNSSARAGTQDFDVYAYNYPAAYFNFDSLSPTAMTAAVDVALSATVQGLNGTQVKSTKSTYLGHASEDAQFTCQTLGGNTTGYIRVFYIGNYQYSIITKGSNQSDFNNFANSFKYTGS